MPERPRGPSLPVVPRRWRPPILAGLFLLSALVTFLVMLPSMRRPATAAAEPRERPVGTEAIDLSVSLPDFLLPEESAAGGQGIELFRRRFTSWSEEQVRRFWIPVREIARDVLERKNDEEVDALFQDLP